MGNTVSTATMDGFGYQHADKWHMSADSTLSKLLVTGTSDQNGSVGYVRVYSIDYVSQDRNIIFERTESGKYGYNAILNSNGIYMAICKASTNMSSQQETIDIYKFDIEQNTYILIQTIQYSDFNLVNPVSGLGKVGCMQFARDNDALLVSAPTADIPPNFATGEFIFYKSNGKWSLGEKTERTQSSSAQGEYGATVTISADASVYAAGDTFWASGAQTKSGRMEVHTRKFASTNSDTVGTGKLYASEIEVGQADIGSLVVKGDLEVKGSLNAFNYISQSSSSNVANVYGEADTQRPANSNTHTPTIGLGTSYDARIFMNKIGDLIVMANVSLKTVYIFRKKNNTWDSFATVAGDTNKHIYKDTPYFGRVVALSGDGLTLTISDMNTIFIYTRSTQGVEGEFVWTESTKTDGSPRTITDANYQTESFCRNMKISDDGSKLLVMSHKHELTWTSEKFDVRVYDIKTYVSDTLWNTPVALVTLLTSTSTNLDHPNPGEEYRAADGTLHRIGKSIKWKYQVTAKQ